MSNFPIYTSHPVIVPPDSPGDEKHYVSISSSDRNLTKNKESNDFFVELPQEYIDVESVRLAASYFPIVDNQFAYNQNNVDLCFKFKAAYVPMDESGCTAEHVSIFAVLADSIQKNAYFRIRIRDGRYGTNDIKNEIVNRMNKVVTDEIAVQMYGTSRLRNWGDFQFSIAYFPSATVQTDLSPISTVDGYNLFYNKTYGSMNAAIQAFNNKHATTIELLSDLNLSTGTSVSIQYSLVELNEFTRGCTPLNPPILLSWPSKVGNSIYGSYLDATTETGKRILDNFTNLGQGRGENGTAISEDLAMKIDFLASGGYNKFRIAVDEVSTKFVFANVADNFEIINDRINYYSQEVQNVITTLETEVATYAVGKDTEEFMPKIDYCASTSITQYQDDIKWGLPIYLGFDGTEIVEEYSYESSVFRGIAGYELPNFYYAADLKGFSTSNLSVNPIQRDPAPYHRSHIYTFTPANAIDLKGEPYFYMDLDTLNCIDEIRPYKDNEYAEINTDSAGTINASFAKLPLSVRDEVAYGRGVPTKKIFSPPLTRLQKIRIRLRFHNGRPVDFGVQPFSITLEVTCKDRKLKLK